MPESLDEVTAKTHAEALIFERAKNAILGFYGHLRAFGPKFGIALDGMLRAG